MNSIINHLGGANGLKLVYEEYKEADENWNTTWTFDAMPKFMVITCALGSNCVEGVFDFSLFTDKTPSIQLHCYNFQYMIARLGSYNSPSYYVDYTNKTVRQEWLSLMPDYTRIMFYA